MFVSMTDEGWWWVYLWDGMGWDGRGVVGPPDRVESSGVEWSGSNCVTGWDGMGGGFD